ncbi:MAG: sulfatase-like hydrolase/transferase [bacterium]|nr:sulfatase-like hydrolase/transferase [bacterium]
MNHIVGSHHILLITLDTLRYDVAEREYRDGNLPNLAGVMPETGWEKRHAPGNFTLSSHMAIFTGFLPTPAQPGKHKRLFASLFPGSETTSPDTVVFDTPDIVSGLASKGYFTMCFGGVGFFNKLSPLGRYMPDLFMESHWEKKFGVTEPESTRNQVEACIRRINEIEPHKLMFLFLNVSALHQPNYFYTMKQEKSSVPETMDNPANNPANNPDNRAHEDNLESHAAALRYVDSQLPPLFTALSRSKPVFVIICSDHGTAYGEDGYWGHRLSHEIVWTVPYMDFILPGQSESQQKEE